MQWIRSLTAALLATSVAVACGSEDDTGTEEGDTGSGGNTASGGAAPTGGDTGAGGSTSTGGSPAAGGSAASLDDRIASTCSTRQQVGFLHGCTAVFGSTYLTDCATELHLAAESCPAEVEAIVDCTVFRPVLDFACDANNEVTFAEGICTEESTALESCLAGGG